MKQRIVSVLALGILLLASFAVGGNGVEPGGSPRVDAATAQKKLWEQFFGPLRARDAVVTGVDASGLARALLPTNAVLRDRRATALGVYHLYSTGGPARTNVGVGVGIFASRAAALDALVLASRQVSAFPPAIRGIGDMAFASNSTFLLLYGNVVVHWSWRATKEETISAAQRIAEELESGDRFVTRGKEVRIPRIVSVELIERVRPGQEATGRITLADVDPAQALIGVDWGIAPWMPTDITAGQEPSITLHVPRDAQGEKKFTLVVATPANVIATKELRILVESR